jgi:hypothetical protein
MGGQKYQAKPHVSVSLFPARLARRLFLIGFIRGLWLSRRVQRRRRTNPTIAVQSKDAGEGFLLGTAID